MKMENAEKLLNYKVFPSEEQTIAVIDDPIYGGAHNYLIRLCKGFNNGATEYTNTWQILDFVKKNDDGSVEEGFQSEQLAYILLDRAIKLNNRFPSEQNSKMIDGLLMFLNACQERVQDRLYRNVMGKLNL